MKARLEGLAFDMDFPQKGWCDTNCAPATLLVTRADDRSMQIVWGAPGRATKRWLTKGPDGWTLDNDLVLGIRARGNHALCADETTLGPATFDFADHDDDGAIDLVISGHYDRLLCADDYTSGYSGDVTLRGKPLVSVPKALGPADGFFPTAGVHIALTQPLGYDSTCVLTPADGSASIPLEPFVMDGYVVGFGSRIVLPLGATYEAHITGESFAGPAKTQALTVRTFEDFGVLVQDGFESGSMAGVYGGILLDSSVLPVIEGNRSLLVKPGVPVMLRLRRTADEKKLVMKARFTNGCYHDDYGSVPLAVGVVGSDTAVHSFIGAQGEFEHFTYHDQPLGIGRVDYISLPLYGDGYDVLVYMLGDHYKGAGCSLEGAIIDDVHLE